VIRDFACRPRILPFSRISAAYQFVGRINHDFFLSRRGSLAAKRLRDVFRPTGKPTLSSRRLARHRRRLGLAG